MSLTERIQKVGQDLDVFAVIVRALDVIGDLAKSANGSNAADVIMAIRHVFETVTRAADKKITSDEAFSELEKMRSGIDANDAAADAAVDAKFDKG